MRLLNTHCEASKKYLTYKIYIHVVIRVLDVLGYNPQELLGELCYDFFHPDDLDHMVESYDQGGCMATSKQTNILNVKYINKQRKI